VRRKEPFFVLYESRRASLIVKKQENNSKMINTSLIRVLKSFDEQELKDFKLFLLSPYFNKKKEMVAFGSYLIKQAPAFDQEKKLARIYVYRQVFPDKKFTQDKAQRLITSFTKLLEQFIIYNSFKKEEVEQKLKLLKFFNKTALDTEFSKTEKQVEALIKEKSVKRDSSYLNAYLLYFERFNFYTSNNSLEKVRKELSGTMELLIVFYLVSQLRLLCHEFNYKNVVKYENDFVTTERILQEALSERFTNIPLIKAYSNTLMFLMDHEKESNFQVVKSMLEEGEFEEYFEDEKLLFDFASNYCALKINAGNTTYNNEIFQLYQMALKKEMLFVDGYLFPNTVKNIVTIAIRLNEIEWIEDFLESYKNRFPLDSEELIYNYNKARLLFHKKQYDLTLNYLDDSDYEDIFHKLAIKRLRIMVYYENNAINLLDSAVNAFYVYVRREDLISDSQVESNRKFINLLKQIISTPKYEKPKLEKLQRKLIETSLLAERNWLKEKILDKVG